MHSPWLLSNLSDPNLFLLLFNTLKMDKGQKKGSLHDYYRIQISQWGKREEEKPQNYRSEIKNMRTLLLSYWKYNPPLSREPMPSNLSWAEKLKLALLISSSWISLNHSGERKTLLSSWVANAHRSHLWDIVCYQQQFFYLFLTIMNKSG